MPTIPDDSVTGISNKFVVEMITSNYLLAPFIINLLIIVSIGSCLAMNSTRWWVLFWMIIFGILPHIYIMYMITQIQSVIDQMDDIRDIVSGESKEINDYMDKLKYSTIVTLVLQLIAFIFLFVSIITHKKFRILSPKVIHHYSSIINNSQK